MSNLSFQEIEFLSSLDEEAFFAWLGKIKCVADVSGEGDEIKISLSQPVSDYELRELIAVTYRYNADMTQLRALLTESNKSWFFDNPESYWHKEIF